MSSLMLCAWAGRAHIRVITVEDGVEDHFEFTTFAPVHLDTLFETKLGNYQFEIESVDPYPGASTSSGEEYSIDFNLRYVE